MFSSSTHQIFGEIKPEPLNYYTNNSGETIYPAYMNGEHYVTPEVTITYDPKDRDQVNIRQEPPEPKYIKTEIVVTEKKSKPQTCKICNKTLASASSYYVHMKQHSDNKPFCCTRCDASFCRKPYLEVHMRVHTGERPYECDVCKKRFTQKSSLNTHKRGHSGLRPYSCNICLKTFTVKSYLTAHQWTHISDSGIVCKECELTFNNKNLYLQHMQSHCSREFECAWCSKAFVKESYLIRHMNKVHNNVIPG